MLRECLENVRKNAPLIHNITNYVTANDVANILLACGASPIMADDPVEAAEITELSRALHINLGTPGQRTIPAMLAAGKRAKELGHPVLLDPVGVGASRFRRETAETLLREIRFDVIRGNISEIKILVGMESSSAGVDAMAADAVTEEGLPGAVLFVKNAARQLESVLAVTGAIDLVTDGESCFVIRGGRPEMSRITGTGCQLSGMMTAFLAANPGRCLEAAAAAVCTMNVAGELAWQNVKPEEGNAAYRNRIIDAVYRMDGETLERGARYELR